LLKKIDLPIKTTSTLILRQSISSVTRNLIPNIRVYQEIKKNDSPNGIDVKGDLSDLEIILKKLYPNVDYSKIEKIVNRVYGK
jgi:hypothetical protein